MQIKGELLTRDGKNRTFDDTIQDLIYYWLSARAALDNVKPIERCEHATDGVAACKFGQGSTSFHVSR
jgi:hypothetical protein